jgi:hypothetical protein
MHALTKLTKSRERFMRREWLGNSGRDFVRAEWLH